MAKKNRPSKRLQTRPIDKMISEVDEDLEASAKATAVDKNLIELSKEENKQFSAWVKARIDDSKSSQIWQDNWDRIRVARENYEKGVPRMSMEMRGSHDYRTHMAAAQADSMAARILNIFTTDPILKFEGRNALGLKNAQKIEQFVDYHHDINVRLSSKGDEISSLLTIEGHCVLYTPWVLELQKNRPTMVMKQKYTDGKKTVLIDVQDKVALENAKGLGLVASVPEAYDVVEVKKTRINKNWPDLKVVSLVDYIASQDGKPGLDKKPSWEAVMIPFTLDDLEKMARNKQIYPGVLKEIKAHVVKKRTESNAESTTAGARGTDTAMEDSSEVLEPEALDAILNCWVIWGKQKVPGYSGLTDAITIFSEDVGKAIQARVNPNTDESAPMFHFRLLTLPWRMAGMGVMEMAAPGEQAVNDLANYILDEGRIFSCLPYKYKTKKFTGGISPFEFWKGLGVKDMKDFEVLQFPDRRPMDMNVASFVRANTERRTGQGDLQLGRESDITGKQPPTARGIMTILQEGQVRYAKPSFSIMHELNRYGQFIVKLFQQYLGSKTPVEILGEDGKDIFPEGVSRSDVMGSFYVTSNLAAQQMSRELDAEMNVQLYQMMQTNPFIAKSLSSFYEMTVDVLKSVGKKNLWVKPLSFYQQAAGKAGEGGQPGAEGQITPQEQQFLQELLQVGVPPEVARQKLEEMRSGVSPEKSAEVAAADQQLLTQGVEEA